MSGAWIQCLCLLVYCWVLRFYLIILDHDPMFCYVKPKRFILKIQVLVAIKPCFSLIKTHQFWRRTWWKPWPTGDRGGSQGSLGKRRWWQLILIKTTHRCYKNHYKIGLLKPHIRFYILIILYWLFFYGYLIFCKNHYKWDIKWDIKKTIVV